MMFYLILALSSIAMAFIVLFKFIITLKPDRKDEKDNKITRKRLIIGILFFSFCSFIIYNYGFNTTERKEGKYLNAIFEEVYYSDEVIKDTAHKGLTNDSIEYLIEELMESRGRIGQLEPPETLPVVVKDSHGTLEDGLEIIINGLRHHDAAELERGQTVVAISTLLYEKYVVEHRDIKKLIKDEYIEGFTLQSKDQASTTSESNEEKSEAPELDYQPEYMSETEWEECIQSNVYTEEECISIDQYYSSGEGVKEPKPEDNSNSDDSVESPESDQQKAYEVQEYVVNVVNDLTIIENMSGDIQSGGAYSSIYGSGDSIDEEYGIETNSPDYDKQFENAMEFIKTALDDLEKQTAPYDTYYAKMEPELKRYVTEYKEILESIRSNGNILGDDRRELQSLDLEIKDFHSALAMNILENYYSEYNALLDVWSKGENYQSSNPNHTILPSGIKMEFIRNGIDFQEDLQGIK